MDLCRKESLVMFISIVLRQSVAVGDSERCGEEILAYKNIEADTAEKCDADCVTGANCRILGDVSQHVKLARSVCQL